MKSFKELLGDLFQENLTQAQIEELVLEKYATLLTSESKLKESEQTLKNSVTKANSECANWRKKYQDTLTEEEQKRIAKEEELTAIIQERDALKKEKAISEYYAQNLALGYDEELAKDTATAMYDNNFTKIFDNQKKFLATQTEKIKANIMKENPTPPAGNPKTITKDDFNKMSYSQLVELQKTNPALYNELLK